MQSKFCISVLACFSGCLYFHVVLQRGNSCTLLSPLYNLQQSTTTHCASDVYRRWMDRRMDYWTEKTEGWKNRWKRWRCQRFSFDCFSEIDWCQPIPSLLEGSGVLLTFIGHLRQGDWRRFSRRHAALQSERQQQNENQRHQATEERKRRRTCRSPWFVRRWWCQGGGPAGTSGCSAASRYVARRTAAATKPQTSETRATGWSAGLKREHSRRRCELLQVIVKHEDRFLLMDTRFGVGKIEHVQKSGNKPENARMHTLQFTLKPSVLSHSARFAIINLHFYLIFFLLLFFDCDFSYEEHFS